MQVGDKERTIDIYIDVEPQRMLSGRYYQRPCIGDYNIREENAMVHTLGNAPRIVHTAPPSPRYSKENVRSYSYRERKATPHLAEYDGDNIQPLSPWRCSTNISPTLSDVLPIKVKLRDFDSAITNTIEVASDTQYSCSVNSPSQSNSLLCQKSLPVHGVEDDHCMVQAPFLQRNACLSEGGLMSNKCVTSLVFENEDNIDKDLISRLEEIEGMIMLTDPEIEELQNGSLSMPDLEQMLQIFKKERTNLKLELCFQLRSRISERSFIKEAFNQGKIHLETKIGKLENEKKELQSHAENELKRSDDMFLEIETLEAEVHRLRACMKEVGEQNVSFQGEVSSLHRGEILTSTVMDSEIRGSSLMTKLKEVGEENEQLHQMLSELQQQYDGAKADWDHIRRKYKEMQKENKDFQRVVLRLQRICNDQETTIIGLRHGISNKIMKQSLGNADLITKLKMEQVRLTGLEQKLRREIESCRFEMESLQDENVHLLQRLLGADWGCGISFIRLDQELRVWVNCLKNQCLTLLDDNTELCTHLLELLNNNQYEHEEKATDIFSCYSLMEYNTKFRSLRKAVQNLKQSLQIISTALDEKSNMGSSDQLHTGSGSGRQMKKDSSLDEMEYKLKVESLLSRVLREKLCQKELELEQWKADLTTSLRSNEILKSEIQRLQNDLSYYKHKTNQMELQVLKRDDDLIQLQCKLQRWTKELTTSRGMLPKISGERDHLWKEVKQLKEINILLEYEVKSLKKKVEIFDEGVFIKDGQVPITKENVPVI